MKIIAVMLLALIALAALPEAHAQWDDCRFGEVNCTGQCGQFIDTDGDGICDHSQPAPGDREYASEEAPVLQQAQGQGGLQAAPAAGSAKTYHFIEIAGLLAIAYALTYGLARKGKMTLVTHRKIWNIFLLVSFVVVGTLGILLVMRINYGLAPLQHFFMLFWHVEVGIAMAVISIFHVLWHWRYYACMIKRGRTDKKCDI